MTNESRPPSRHLQSIEHRNVRGRTWLLAGAVFIMYVLHQDIWFWTTAKPLVFGFVPVGLFYHAVYSMAVVGLMVLLVRYAWPSTLSDHPEDEPPSEDA